MLGAVLQREALLLRGAALDGCDSSDSCTVATGTATSASAVLAIQAEAHSAALQQLLKQTEASNALQQNLSRFLPLREKDIPSDLAVRLAKPWLAVPTAAAATGLTARAAASVEETTENSASAAEAQRKVLRCLRKRASVDEPPEAALSGWLAELLGFADSTLAAEK